MIFSCQKQSFYRKYELMLYDDSFIRLKLEMQEVKGAVVVDSVLKDCKLTPNVLSIPKGVRVLANGCLSGQDNLSVLILPSTIEFVGDSVLSNCPNLVMIKCYSDLRLYEKKLMYGNKAKVFYV